MVNREIHEVTAQLHVGSQAREGCKSYLEGLQASKVRDLQDIIKFNEANKDIEFDAGNSSLYAAASHFTDCRLKISALTKMDSTKHSTLECQVTKPRETSRYASNGALLKVLTK